MEEMERKIKRGALPWLLAAALATVTLAAGEARAGGLAQKGESAPNFILRTMEGRTVSLFALRGKVVLLNFWATWCPPCTEEMPILDKLQRDYAGEDFVVLAIAADRSSSDIERFLAREGPFEMRILHDKRSNVGRAYGVRAMPISFLIGRSGYIEERYIGPRNWDSPQLRRLIDSLLR